MAVGLKILSPVHSVLQSSHADGALWDLPGLSKHAGHGLDWDLTVPLHPTPDSQDPKRPLLSWCEYLSRP